MVNVWVALMGLMIIGLVGLASDAAFIWMTAHQLQNSADAASLAAAQEIRDGTEADVRQTAIDFALVNPAAKEPVQLDWNGANAPEGDIVLGQWDLAAHAFTPTTSGANAVRVVARRTEGSLGGALPIIFGRIFGVTTINLERSAIAYNRGDIGAGMIVLCEDCPCGLRFSGQVNLTLDEAEGLPEEGIVAIHNNSSEPCATCGNGSSLTIVADELNMVGGACWNGQPTVQADVNEGQPVAPDPLADLPDPPYDAAADLGSIVDSGTYQPGYYSGGIRLEGGDNVVLEPGIYVVDGEGLRMSGDSSILAEGVMFYIVGTGALYLGGTGASRITPSDDPADPYYGISVFQARDNTNGATIIGTSDMDLEGTYYFPAANLEIGGEGVSLGNQMIAYTMYLHGSGSFDVAYNGNYPIESNRVFLVE
jgi:hypothetical protein